MPKSKKSTNSKKRKCPRGSNRSKSGRCIKRKSPIKRTKSPAKKAAKQTRVGGEKNVWVGELGDIRINERGPVIGWATEDGTMVGKFVPFKKNKMQKNPRIEALDKKILRLANEANLSKEQIQEIVNLSKHPTFKK